MDKNFKKGDTVWAKMKGFPFWPGIITDPLKEMKKPAKDNVRCVYFFGSKNYSWIDINNLKDYVAHKSELGMANKSSLKIAVNEIEEFLKQGNSNLFTNADPFDQLISATSTPKAKKVNLKRKKSTDKKDDSQATVPKKQRVSRISSTKLTLKKSTSKILPTKSTKAKGKDATKEKAKTKDKSKVKDKAKTKHKIKAKDKTKIKDKTIVKDKIRAKDKTMAKDKSKAKGKTKAKDKVKIKNKNKANAKGRPRYKVKAKSKVRPKKKILKKKRIVGYSSSSPRPSYISDNIYFRMSLSTPKIEVEPLNLEKCSEELLKKKIKPSELTFGFIGLGVKGSRILKNIVHSKHKVIIWNRTEKKCEQFENIGVEVAQNPLDVGRVADIIFLCVGGDDAVIDVIFGSNLKFAIKTGNVSIVNLSKISNETSNNVSDLMEAFQCRYLEVHTLGTLKEADMGTLQTFAAGDKSLFEDCESCLNAISSKIHYNGKNTEEACKLHALSIIKTNLASKSIAEGIDISKRSGTSVSQFFELLKTDHIFHEDFVGTCKLRHDRKELFNSSTLGPLIILLKALSIRETDILLNLACF